MRVTLLLEQLSARAHGARLELFALVVATLLVALRSPSTACVFVYDSLDFNDISTGNDRDSAVDSATRDSCGGTLVLLVAFVDELVTVQWRGARRTSSRSRSGTKRGDSASE